MTPVPRGVPQKNVPPISQHLQFRGGGMKLQQPNCKLYIFLSRWSSPKGAPMFRLGMVQLKAFGCFNETLAPATKIFGLVKLVFGGFLYTYTSLSSFGVTHYHHTYTCYTYYVTGETSIWMDVSTCAAPWSSSRSSFDVQALVILRYEHVKSVST